MNMTHYDVIIVGAGLVGMVLAQALSGHGLRIGLVEARSLPTTHDKNNDSRALALSYSSQKILQTLQLWADIATQATPISSVHVSYEGMFAKLHMRARELKMESLGYVVPAQELAAILGNKVAENNAINTYTHAAVQSITIKPKWAELVIQQAGQTLPLCARLVVAADGSHSLIAKQLHIQQTTEHYQQTAIVATINTSIGNEGKAYERFTPKGVIALLPLHKNAWGVVWSTSQSHANELLSLSDMAYLQELQKHVRHYWGTDIKIGARHAYPLMSAYTHETIRPHVVIMGNAARTLHPIAAQGLNLALRSVAWLAEMITDNPEKIGEVDMLRQYADMTAEDQQRVQHMSHSLVEMSNRVSQGILWNIGLSVFDKLTMLKRSFMKTAMGLSGTQAKLVRGVELG